MPRALGRRTSKQFSPRSHHAASQQGPSSEGPCCARGKRGPIEVSGLRGSRVEHIEPSPGISSGSGLVDRNSLCHPACPGIGDSSNLSPVGKASPNRKYRGFEHPAQSPSHQPRLKRTPTAEGCRCDSYHPRKAPTRLTNYICTSPWPISGIFP